MIGQLLIPALSSLGGAISGYLESRSANEVELKKLDIEARRDERLAVSGELKVFHETLDRQDDPKQFVLNGHNLFGKPYEKKIYKYVPIPARTQRFYIVLVYSIAYALTVCWAGYKADMVIWSFPSSPDSYKWLSFFGFTLVEGTKVVVHQLTLGGLILPLLSPISFMVTKYVTGADIKK
jgi:hypothetical protein